MEAGLRMLLERGYHDLGIRALLEQTGIPKGSFYHHFEHKEDFALQVIDAYMTRVHAGLDTCLNDTRLEPLDRARAFFEATQEQYQSDGYLGCMLGGLGQELSGVNEVFRERIESCLSQISTRLSGCLEEASKKGQLSGALSPLDLANLLVNCWEGAALRTRLLRDPAPLTAILDFYFKATRSA